MCTYTYHQPGRQTPVFLCPQAEAVQFTLEGNAHLQVSYDPPESRQPAWHTYEGGSAGVLYGPPIAVRVVNVADTSILHIYE